MAFKNRIRLPFKLTRPQYPEERVNFRKADGITKTLSVVIRKEYEGETDYFPESWHEKLKIALAHDNITIEGDKYIGDIAQTGEYSIEWVDFLDYPTAKAKFKADVTPFSETNSNCMTCEEATQLDLTDDTITALYGDPLEEGESYEWNVAENDSICCYPAVFSATWFNTDYLSAFSIDQSGVINITLGTDLISANGLKIATYRVTCPNGNYDEADVFANIEGAVEGCLAPTDLEITNNDPTEQTYSWTQPFVGGTYEYELYAGSAPVGSPVQSGLIDVDTFVTLTGLTENTDYYFRVRTVCYGSNSNWIFLAATTSVGGEGCGEYNIAVDDGTGIPTNFYNIQYVNCSGVWTSAYVYNMQSRIICAIESSPGNPVQISGTYSSISTITYNGSC